MKRALIIEDDTDIAGLVELHLRDMHFETETEGNGKRGYERALEQEVDLIVLDIMLPEMDGIEICTRLRGRQVQTPIVMLTAKSDEMDKVLGLESGADVYISKPFSIVELKSRVKALFRRIEIERHEDAKENDRHHFRYGDLEINVKNRSVHLRKSRVELTPKEFDLLALLAAHPGRSYSREELLRKVWGYEYNGYEHTVNSHINRLRSKIEADMSAPRYILTTWGIGYRFSEGDQQS